MTHSVRATHNEQLRDPLIATAYLNEALDDSDAAMILMALRYIAEAQKDGVESDLGAS